MKWVRVDDRLPDIDGYVLCNYKGNLSFVGILIEDEFMCNGEFTPATHWMPLPNPPEET